MAWLMLQYLTGGAWGVVIRRPAEAAARTLPLMALMFLPIVIGIPNLYPWSHTRSSWPPMRCCSTRRPISTCRSSWSARRSTSAAGCSSAGVQPLVAQEDRTAPPAAHGKMSALAGPGLIFWGFSVTFMSIDWVLSHRSALVLHDVRPALHRRPGAHRHGLPDRPDGAALLPPARCRSVLTPRHLHDLGKFLLALVMVWAYFSFSQFLIIWAGNLPEEIPWYLRG